MKMHEDRRRFLKASTVAVAANLLPNSPLLGPSARGDDRDRTIRVVVWDERQPQQKQAYENFLGNAIAEHLRSQPGLSVESVAPDDPEQGLAEDVLGACDVLVWWGHARQAEVTPETGRKIVARIVAGDLALIALHSAHWSTPFVEAMYERTRRDAERTYGRRGRDEDRDALHAAVPAIHGPRARRAADALRGGPQVPRRRAGGRGPPAVLLLPRLPGGRQAEHDPGPEAGPPDRPGHPPQFEVPQTEMYDEPFHVPEPDEVVLEECWASGEWFRSGMVWQLGEGRVFYFRPGHETYPVYKQPMPLRILTNAVRWLGTR